MIKDKELDFIIKTANRISKSYLDSDPSQTNELIMNLAEIVKELTKEVRDLQNQCKKIN